MLSDSPADMVYLSGLYFVHDECFPWKISQDKQGFWQKDDWSLWTRSQKFAALVSKWRW